MPIFWQCLVYLTGLRSIAAAWADRRDRDFNGLSIIRIAIQSLQCSRSVNVELDIGERLGLSESKQVFAHLIDESPVTCADAPVDGCLAKEDVIVSEPCGCKHLDAPLDPSTPFCRCPFKQRELAANDWPAEAISGLCSDGISVLEHCLRFLLALLGVAHFRKHAEKDRFIAPRPEFTRQIQCRVSWCLGLRKATGGPVNIGFTLKGKHFAEAVTNPSCQRPGFFNLGKRFFHLEVVEETIPNHALIGWNDAQQAMLPRDVDAVAEMANGRTHAPLQVCGIAQPAIGAGLPLRLSGTLCSRECQAVLAQASLSLASCEVEVAADIVDFG